MPTQFWTFQPKHSDRRQVNERLVKLYQLKGQADFLYSQGSYAYFLADAKS